MMHEERMIVMGTHTGLWAMNSIMILAMMGSLDMTGTNAWNLCSRLQANELYLPRPFLPLRSTMNCDRNNEPTILYQSHISRTLSVLL